MRIAVRLLRVKSVAKHYSSRYCKLRPVPVENNTSERAMKRYDGTQLTFSIRLQLLSEIHNTTSDKRLLCVNLFRVFAKVLTPQESTSRKNSFQVKYLSNTPILNNARFYASSSLSFVAHPWLTPFSFDRQRRRVRHFQSRLKSFTHYASTRTTYSTAVVQLYIGPR